MLFPIDVNQMIINIYDRPRLKTVEKNWNKSKLLIHQR